MLSETLSAIAGIILSLACSYIPGLNEKFAKLTPEEKRLVMLLLLIVTALAVFGLGCAGQYPITCDQAGALGLLRILIAAVMANQATFLISPKLSKMKYHALTGLERIR